jgi:hypothetical protein
MINTNNELYKKFSGTPRGSLESPGGFKFRDKGKDEFKPLCWNSSLWGFGGGLEETFL